MNLVKLSRLMPLGCLLALGACATAPTLTDAGVSIASGSGSFVMPGSGRHADQTIVVHYYRPANFTAKSPVLIVLPGAGRNGDAYRDAWIAAADRAGILIASPSYPENGYDVGAYQMGGIIANLKIGEPQPGSTESSLYLRDEDMRFDVNARREDWIFGDFDRLFGLLTRATGSKQRHYDLFGHSAGGQLAARAALLNPGSRAGRIVAANAGLYTLPDPERALPLGIAGLGIREPSLRSAFAVDLTLLLGENDNDPDRGGQHLHTPLLDAQGRDRLSRGRNFYAFSSERAKSMGAPFEWKLQTVPGVGHNFRGMSRAAAKLLYGVE
jgi:pimeloyl-ACP methyl ester carboxylesterase